MRIITGLTFLLSLSVFAQDIADIPSGASFKFDMDNILKKQKECLKNGDDYRIKNQVHFINGKLDCNGPIFQRSCFVELPENKTLKPSEVCHFDSTNYDPHFIELVFSTNNCPILKCRPLMWTGLFTGPDISVKSLQYNTGKFVLFKTEEGINLNGKSTSDKTPQMNKTIKSNSGISVQGQ